MRWAVFIRSELELDELASELRAALDLPAVNPTEHQRDQRRHGLNMGGIYYLFEVFGLELTLLANRGEVLVEECSAFDYYLAISSVSEPAEERIATQIVRQLSAVQLVAESAPLD